MEKAIVLTGGRLATDDAKTAHGLIRESNRFLITGMVDKAHAGQDAGEVLDGRKRNIPIFADVAAAMVTDPVTCIVGVATVGGVFPGNLLEEVKTAIRHRLSIVNGLHDYLSQRPEITQLAAEYQVTLTDIRLPRNISDLHFWTGKIFGINVPVIAVIGTDCSLGKRTTARMLINACAAGGLSTQMIYTGQTGWLQGGKYGFILDSTLNDFVSGELEHALLSCERETRPDCIFIEGQSALRNPSGPCGAELLVSGNARYVILIHAPKRKYYEHEPAWGRIPGIASEIDLIEHYGASVIGVALNTEGCTTEEATGFIQHYEQQLGIPVMLPIQEGCASFVPVIRNLVNTFRATL